VPEYLSDLSEKINGHARIEVLLNTEISNVKGFIGNFTTTVRSQGSERELAHGVIILATGGAHLVPDEYLYGRSERVTLWHELEDLFESRPETLEQTEGVAFIQCVGSREPDRPYCSKVCCTSSIQQAIDFKTRKPDLNVYILYRDIRTYGQRENLYRKARELGVIFIRFSLDEKPVVEKATIDGKEKLKITVKDHILGIPVQLHVDYLNLATAIVPKGQEALAKMLKVSLNEDGFFLEAHVKLRPVDFATDGVFVCGLAHYPKPIEESIAQAQAAAARAASILSKESVEMAPIVSVVDRDKCIGCGLCEASCPFGAIQLVKVTGRGYKAENISALCKGCGICAAACPQHAIDMKHFRDQQILAAVEAGGAKG
jgi:heterodisulfide reductase subunit A